MEGGGGRGGGVEDDEGGGVGEGESEVAAFDWVRRGRRERDCVV